MLELKSQVDDILSKIPSEKIFVNFDPDSSWYYVVDLPHKIELTFNIYEETGLDEISFFIKQDREIIIDDWLDFISLKNYILEVLRKISESE